MVENTNGDDVTNWVVESLIKAFEDSNEVIRKKSSVSHIRKHIDHIEKRLGNKITIELIATKTFKIRRV